MEGQRCCKLRPDQIEKQRELLELLEPYPCGMTTRKDLGTWVDCLAILSTSVVHNTPWLGLLVDSCRTCCFSGWLMELTHLLTSIFMERKHRLGIVPELRQDGVGNHQLPHGTKN